MVCIKILYVHSTYIHILGCNNGGGGGNFSKVKRLVANWNSNTATVILCFLVPLDFRKAETFSEGIFHLPINPNM